MAGGPPACKKAMRCPGRGSVSSRGSLLYSLGCLPLERQERWTASGSPSPLSKGSWWWHARPASGRILFLFPQQGGARRMTHQGAVLQSYNNELVKYMEDLCLQREELNKQIGQAEEEKCKVQDELGQLTKQLESVCERLEGKIAAQEKLDKILLETELAYEKILESTRMLLTVLKTEMGDLDETIMVKSNKAEHVQIFGLQQTQQ